MPSLSVKSSQVMAKAGDGLLKELKKLEVSQSQVGRQCQPQVTPQTVGRWIKALNDESITDDQWLQFCHGLRVSGIRPEEFRPIPIITPRLRTELIPLLSCFEGIDQLEALIALLIADPEAKEPVLLIARDRLERLRRNGKG